LAQALAIVQRLDQQGRLAPSDQNLHEALRQLLAD
jgi:hypothetical protein